MTDKFEDRLEGIPQWLNKVERLVSDNVSKYNKFTIKFEKATENKKNLDDILKPFLVYLLEGTLKTFNHDTFKDVKDSIDHVIRLLKKENVTEEELKSAIDNTTGVAKAAFVAYWSSDVADVGAAVDAANWAANCAAWAAVLSGSAATCAANCAVWATNCAALAVVWANAESALAAEDDFYDGLAEKLLELIKGVK